MTTYTPTWTSTHRSSTGYGPKLNNGTLIGEYKLITKMDLGEEYEVKIVLEMGNETTYGDLPWVLSLPFPALLVRGHALCKRGLYTAYGAVPFFIESRHDRFTLCGYKQDGKFLQYKDSVGPLKPLTWRTADRLEIELYMIRRPYAPVLP